MLILRIAIYNYILILIQILIMYNPNLLPGYFNLNIIFKGKREAERAGRREREKENNLKVPGHVLWCKAVCMRMHTRAGCL